MIDSFAGAVGASLTHDVFLYLIYAFSAVLLAIPITALGAVALAATQ